MKKQETQALFILGNLQCNFQPTTLYCAYNEGVLVGVCGYYYSPFPSASIFAEDAEISRKFGKLLAANAMCPTLLGMSSMVKPAYEEFLTTERKSLRDPETNFFELSLGNFRPFHFKKGVI